MSGSTRKRCACTDDAGRQLGPACPKLRGRRHGTWGYDLRVLTTGGKRTLRRYGFATQNDAHDALQRVNDLIRLADDDAQRRAIGDMIFERSRRGGKLPAVEDVRRRLGLGLDPAAPGLTVADWLDTWLAARARTRRDSTIRSYEQHARVWIKPVLGEIALERLTPAHIEDMLVTAPPRQASAATRQRVFATLRAALNAAVRQRRISWNPCAGVELEPDRPAPARHWSREDARQFLGYSAADNLGLLFRIAVLRGARRGELCGVRWADADLADGIITVTQTLLEIGGTLTYGRPKTRAGERRIYLGPVTAQLLREHRKAQLAARLLAGEAWEDHDLIFCRADGSPWHPDYVSKRFRRLAAEAGVPVIKMHEARHTALSLMRDAGVDKDVRMREAGHADQEVADRYTHLADETHRQAAADTEAYVDGAAS